MRSLESVGAEEVLSTLRAELHVIAVGKNLGRSRCESLYENIFDFREAKFLRSLNETGNGTVITVPLPECCYLYSSLNDELQA